MVDSLYSLSEIRWTAPNKSTSWQKAEEYIREKHDLTEDHGAWHDARDEDGNPYEIKSCVYEYSTGREGQFEIWRSQLNELLHEGYFAFLVYVPTTTHRVLATHIAKPERLLVSGEETHGTHPTMGDEPRRRIPWTEVVPLDSIKFGARNHFVEHYSDEEIEKTIFLNPPEEDQ